MRAIDVHRLIDRFRALANQVFIVELHAVSGLLLDAFPERLELFPIENRLSRLDRFPRVGVLHFQSARHFPQHLADLLQLSHERLWYRQRTVPERSLEGILHLAGGIDVASFLEVVPQHLGLLKAQGL